MAKRASGGGETVLEGRHVLAVFFAIVVLSAVFFTLGYVLGRMQGEAKSAAAQHRAAESPTGGKAAASGAASSSPQGGSPSDLSFYESVEKKNVDATLSPQPAAPTSALPAKPAPSKKIEPAPRTPAQAGGITLQVAALLKREDAESVAEVLRHKKYPVVVLPPSSDHFYRVQVGPFANEQTAGQMRKRLENEGFKVITKR